jgi:RNA polymerase sigma-70 factor (ECF subfamily)
VGILKHKVVDAFRHHNREVSGHQPTADDEEDPLEYIAFEPDGHFVKAPAAWENPADFVQRRQFFEVLELCVERLPVTQGRLFLMREWLELPCDEICKELGLTSTNLYVQLHRARLRLRECLEQHWFLKAVKE